MQKKHMYIDFNNYIGQTLFLFISICITFKIPVLVPTF